MGKGRKGNLDDGLSGGDLEGKARLGVHRATLQLTLRI